ncbi:hypothetical protein F4553_000661 [Allocatelliglobosispora scoriae]|uniref:Uncharacterized protein n=1 Tax=Allocatelliglobosispora scoriae TaxID=643052 RepID=A0A841BKK3_9ACTN|nr:hypothetical protein [Allocatelliglobosispora scoriae]MBB5867282.1 hypothetical protein [Allocatelliglobosispora scoriae]
MTDHHPAEPYPTAPYPAYLPPGQVGYGPMIPPPAPKKSRLWLWLGITAVALLLCCGGGTTAGIVLYNASEQSAGDPIALPPVTADSPEPTPQPTLPLSTPTPTLGSSVTLVAPKKLAGYPHIDNPAFATLVEALKAQMQTIPGAEVGGVVSGVYGDVVQHQMRLMVAVKADLPNPEMMPDAILNGLKTSGAKTSNFGAVPPGPLGGAAQCGDVRQSNVDMALCVWADDASFGMIFFYYVKATTVKAVFLQARGEIESRA